MKFGLFTLPYQRLPMEKAFEDAARLGYDYIELWGGYPHAWAPDVVADRGREICRLSEQWEIPVVIYTPEHNGYPYNYMMGNERQWRNCMDYFASALTAARLIGAEYMLISVGHGGKAPEEHRHERLRRSLSHLTHRAEQEGVKLLLETLTPLESNTCTRLTELYTVFEEFTSPALFAVCDMVPPFLQGENPADYARLLGDRLRHLHLVDSDGISDRHLIPGEGVMELRRVISEFRQMGYDGTATLELVTEYLEDPTGAARLALMRAKELLT